MKKSQASIGHKGNIKNIKFISQKQDAVTKEIHKRLVASNK